MDVLINSFVRFCGKTVIEYDLVMGRVMGRVEIKGFCSIKNSSYITQIRFIGPLLQQKVLENCVDLSDCELLEKSCERFQVAGLLLFCVI